MTKMLFKIADHCIIAIVTEVEVHLPQLKRRIIRDGNEWAKVHSAINRKYHQSVLYNITVSPDFPIPPSEITPPKPAACSAPKCGKQNHCNGQSPSASKQVKQSSLARRSNTASRSPRPASRHSKPNAGLMPD